jgi:hypothetical protein
MLTLQSSPGPAVTGVTESRGKFVAGKRLFPGLFPMRARRSERPISRGQRERVFAIEGDSGRHKVTGDG